ncbi:NDP-hexose 2,3-dehydratase family protein [Amycolatopsis sp. NPDC049688]|uniref:NDP-hexose 2,3-dehydratase family protein n=1 Tax=Amycolatopsis sp. NPDC049688 TaxID=3154733 RepID=UPI0034469D93
MSTAGLLTTTDDDLLRRFTESANTHDRVVVPTPAFHEWFAERQAANSYQVTQVPFGELAGWRFQPGSGNLVHDSGRFFAVEGLAVHTDHGEHAHWTQPIIRQPETGILGILVKEFNGVLHCLMQAKMEPGNVNLTQLSPTLQATRSNYTRVHKGKPIPYLEYFTAPWRGRVLVDVLQSEQGAWFLHKRNRNMVIEVTDDIPVLEDFCWLTLAQLHELLHVDNLVNMDSRTVLSGIPFAAPVDRPSILDEDSFRGSLLRSLAERKGALHELPSVLSWFTEAKTKHSLDQQRIPLNQVDGWYSTDKHISHDNGRYFSVIGVDVQASNREVAHWTQPMLAPVGRGLLAFLAKRIGGVLHVLVQARTQAGTFDVIEMAPTVHCTPENYEGAEPPRYLRHVLDAPPEAVKHDVVHSEEGGRFHHAENRYVVVEVGDDFPVEVPPDFIWMTARQATNLVRYSNYFNVEARSLLTGLHTLW